MNLRVFYLTRRGLSDGYLWAANFLTLEQCGLPMEHIQVSGVCTYTQSDRFFSARRLGINSGRIFTGIMKK